MIRLSAVLLPFMAASAAQAEAQWLELCEVPESAHVVQVGAFREAHAAGAFADALAARRTDLPDGTGFFLEPVHPVDGMAFVRLRYGIFADLDESRRFCIALYADGEACVPVVQLRPVMLDYCGA